MTRLLHENELHLVAFVELMDRNGRLLHRVRTSLDEEGRFVLEAPAPEVLTQAFAVAFYDADLTMLTAVPMKRLELGVTP